VSIYRAHVSDVILLLILAVGLFPGVGSSL